LSQGRSLVASLPNTTLISLVGEVKGVETVEWDLAQPAPRLDLDFVLLPYMASAAILDRLAPLHVRWIQSQMLGFDGVAERLPSGATYCNAVGVHEIPTAELALTLILASLRQLPVYVRQQSNAQWAPFDSGSLAGRSVLVIGQGGLGQAIAARLRPFDVTLARVASRARVDSEGPVFGIDTCHERVPEADIVVLAVPLTSETTGLVDAAFLARMRPGALLVNVARGPVVVTDALVQALHDGRICAALDVVDPEPLPPDHPLWASERCLLTPHIGGMSTSRDAVIAQLVRHQLRRLVSGEDPSSIAFASTS
jgi:phosphoglycerate dehydrogenase-like enzyme